MAASWIVLVPPLLVLGAAALTRNVIGSLLLGIGSAALIFTHGSPLPALIHATQTIAGVISQTGNIHLFAFLLLLGTIIELMTHVGGIAAYTALLRRYVSTRKGAETTSLSLSLIFFLDDYLNSLVTGSIMRPLTDALRIPRVKLAFLINSMSSPLCAIIPATTWAATIIGQLQASGVSDQPGAGVLVAADPLITYLIAIPFVFYSFFIIGSAWFIVRRRIAFGSMYEQERIAEENGNLFGGKEAPSQQADIEVASGSILNFLVPIGTFIISIPAFILYSGGHRIFGGSHGFIDTLKNAATTWSLLASGITALTVMVLLLAAQGQFSPKALMLACWRGIKLMKNSLIVLILAFTLGALLNNDLQTGAYLAKLISASLPIALLPLIIFLLATITTASTGSSWGTIGVLMPLAIKTLVSLAHAVGPVSPFDIPTFFVSIGALLAGSVAGAHFSPITDATVVSAMSAGAYHLDHVKTQVSYSIPAFIGSCCAITTAGMTYAWGLWSSYTLAGLSGLLITLGLLMLRNKYRK